MSYSQETVLLKLNTLRLEVATAQKRSQDTFVKEELALKISELDLCIQAIENNRCEEFLELLAEYLYPGSFL